MSVGVSLAIARHARGLSLQQAADIIGCTKAHVWNLEAGRTANPAIRTIVGLSAAYGIPVAVLAMAFADEITNQARTPPMATATPTKTITLSAEERERFRQFLFEHRDEPCAFSGYHWLCKQDGIKPEPRAWLRPGDEGYGDEVPA